MKPDGRLGTFLTVLCVTACLGTLTSVTISLAASVLIMFLAPILLVPYIAWGAWAIAMRSMGRLRSIPPLLAIVVTIVGVPACGYLPYGLASLELRLRTESIPGISDLKVSRITPDPFGNATTGPGIVYRLEPQKEALPILRDLQEKLVEDGWSIVVGGVPGARGSNVGVLFVGPTGRSLDLRGSWNRTLHTYEDIEIRQNFSPLSPVVLLLVQIAGGVISAAWARQTRREQENGNGV